MTSQVHLPSEPAHGGRSAQSPLVTGEQAAGSALAGAGYARNGLYVSRDGEVLRLTLGYPSGDPRMAAAARTIQRQLGVIGIEVDLLPDATPNLVETRIACGAIDLALLAVPRGIVGRGGGGVGLRLPADSVLGIGSTVTTGATATETTDGGTPGDATRSADAGSTRRPAATPEATDDAAPSPRTGNLSGYCRPATQQTLADAISGRGTATAADPSLWADLPVLPLIQQSAVFAVAEPLRTVLEGPHDGWAWSGPLSGLSGWPVN